MQGVAQIVRKLIDQLNRIACSHIMASSDADLLKLDSPDYCE